MAEYKVEINGCHLGLQYPYHPSSELLDWFFAYRDETGEKMTLWHGPASYNPDVGHKWFIVCEDEHTAIQIRLMYG